MNEEENHEKKDQMAKDVAAIMVENMKKNMEDPDYFDKREKIRQEAASEVIKRREERHKKLEDE
ncbi:MAG: hypothetical protein KGD70_02720 [Candidatus Lokiarchaeota archaeon]|nr:hypothetical protein [Candidatus Lokiarchaeota archaeon]